MTAGPLTALRPADAAARLRRFQKPAASAGLLLVTLIWGSAFVVMKTSMDHIPPTYLLACRFSVAALGMAALFFRQLRAVTRSELLGGAAAGAFLFISYYFQTYGLKYTTAGKNAFITTFYVMIVPFLSWALIRVRPRARHLAAAFLALAGLALLSLNGDRTVQSGDVLTLICSFCFAAHMVLLERITENGNPVRLTAVQMASAALCAWVVAAATEGTLDLRIFREAGMLSSILYLGLFSSMLCFLLQTAGQKYVSASAASILLSFESVFGMAFSVLLLDERLTARMLCGCALMFAAAVLAELTPPGKPDPEKSK